MNNPVPHVSYKSSNVSSFKQYMEVYTPPINYFCTVYTSLSASISRRSSNISGNVGRSFGFTFQQFVIISYLKRRAYSIYFLFAQN
jgi:hypothetical protein